MKSLVRKNRYTYFTISESGEGTFGFSGLQKFHNSSQARRGQQNSPQRAMRREESFQVFQLYSRRQVLHQNHRVTPLPWGLDIFINKKIGREIVFKCLCFFHSFFFSEKKKKRITWLKESRDTPLSSRNCLVSWTICVSPSAILTARLPCDSYTHNQTHKHM